MRVVSLKSPWKGHQPLYVFDFLISLLNILKDFKVLSRFMQNSTQSPACSFTVCIECCLPIGWRTFIWWKNPPKCSSILVRVTEWLNFLPANRNPKNNCCLSRIYGIRFGEKRLRLEHMQTVNRTSRRIGSGLWRFLKYSRAKIKN